MIPYPYQKECLQEMEDFQGRTLVSLDMGLGKTPISLWHLRRHLPKSLPAVIVCPASVKWQWFDEIQHVMKKTAFVCEGRIPPRDFPDHDIFLVNYDILAPVTRKVKGVKKTYPGWSAWLRRLCPKNIILDECQSIANYTSRTQACRRLCKNVKGIIALSGTPLLNRPMELFNTLNIIRPDLFSSRIRFGQRYCGPVVTPWAVEYKGSSNERELHELLTDNLMIRRKKRDVLPDLPDKIRRVITLPVKNIKEYKQARDSFLAWLHGKDPIKAAKAIKAEALVRVPYLLRLAAELKLDYAIEWINSFMEDSDEKLVVFAKHKHIISELNKRTVQKSVVIDGSVTGRRRTDTVNQFKNDDEIRLLIGNIQAAGTGIDGLQVAKNAAFVELPWQPGAALQAEDRIYRIGTVEDVWIWYLVAKDTAEVKLCKLLQHKQEIASSVLDGEHAEAEYDVFSKLLESILEED